MRLNSRLLIYTMLLGVFFVQLISCNQVNVYEKDTSIPNYQWKSDFEVKGSFSVTDTSAAYNIYIVLRHTDAYKYNNIWLNVGTQSPGDSMRYQKIDLPLGTDATGWMGTGMNDIWELRQPLFDQPKKLFTKPGTYTFSISQIMRDNPLPSVMSAGLRLQKE